MKSMTGYAYRERASESYLLNIELKAFNNRYLDIAVNLPGFLGPLDPVIRELTGKRVLRGRVEISVRLRLLEEDLTVHIDRRTASAYTKALRELIELEGLEDTVKLDSVIQLEGVLKTEYRRDAESFRSVIEEELELCFEAFEQARIREGEATRTDIDTHLAALQSGLDRISELVPAEQQRLKDDLLQKFQEVLGNRIDENRYLSETAVILSRYDIGEEIARLRSHLDNFRSIASGEGTVGKRLDFICQEINREVNTIGSKSTDVSISNLVVDMKEAVEKIREQLRNVE
ncbi:MAG: YicC family protein [Spirochaetales bacterium]|nr:YicC family protein [Spirochaetales bacterium]MCF7937129.1 YicC family protein [Spirochaetales bacterium]